MDEILEILRVHGFDANRIDDETVAIRIMGEDPESGDDTEIVVMTCRRDALDWLNNL